MSAMVVAVYPLVTKSACAAATTLRRVARRSSSARSRRLPASYVRFPVGIPLDSRATISAESSSTLNRRDAMSGPIDPTTALDRAYSDLAKVVADLDSEQLSRPTNCPSWDVRGLLNHILGGALMYVRVNDGEVAGEDAGDVAGDNPAAA